MTKVWILSGVISCNNSVCAGGLLQAQHGPGEGVGWREGEEESHLLLFGGVDSTDHFLGSQ